jgi:hypothetical protein
MPFRTRRTSVVSKWAWLKDRFPALPADPSYGDAIIAQVEAYRELPLAEIAEAYNDCEEEIAERERELKEVKMRREAAERAMHQQMEAAGLDSVTVAGFKWTPKVEPYPSVKDKAAFRAWAGEKMPDNLSLPFPTLKSVVKEALESGEELPPGIDVYLKGSFSRTKQ